jgi:PAS domain S-box-containing protein/putative nucleotidyltransferase with HDIG domain
MDAAVASIMKSEDRRFNDMVDNLPVMVFEADAKGQLFYANRKCLDIMGYSLQDIKGGANIFHRLTLADNTGNYGNIAGLFGTDRKIEATLLVKKRDGSSFPVVAHVSRIVDNGFNKGFRGVLVEKAAPISPKEKSRESEEKYRLLIENSNDAVFVIQNGRIKFVNRRTSKILGYPRDELARNPFLEIIHPDDRYIISTILKSSHEDTQLQATPLRFKDKRARTKWVEINSARVEWEDKEAFIFFAKDITDRKKIEDNLQKSHRRNFERIQKALDTTIEAIGTIVETRDPYTSGHQRRVAMIAGAIAEEMKLFEEQKYAVRTAAMVHDVGKIYVPAEVLSKPVRLTPVEFGLMKTHPQVGYDILKNIEFSVPIAAIVMQHHEKIDGSGYPKGLSGKNIFIESRIIAVADVVEAMASHRPYRPSLGLDKALEEIKMNSGILYDADVVDACLLLFNQKGFRLPVIS